MSQGEPRSTEARRSRREGRRGGAEAEKAINLRRLSREAVRLEDGGDCGTKAGYRGARARINIGDMDEMVSVASSL